MQAATCSQTKHACFLSHVHFRLSPVKLPPSVLAFNRHAQAVHVEQASSSQHVHEWSGLHRGSHAWEQGKDKAFTPSSDRGPPRVNSDALAESSQLHYFTSQDKGKRRRATASYQRKRQNSELSNFTPPHDPTSSRQSSLTSTARLDSTPPDSSTSATSSNSTASSDSSNSLVPLRPWFDPKKHAASQITRRIKACSTWQELEQLHQNFSRDLDFIHLAAMLSRLAHLVSRGASCSETRQEVNGAMGPLQPSKPRPMLTDAPESALRPQTFHSLHTSAPLPHEALQQEAQGQSSGSTAPHHTSTSTATHTYPPTQPQVFMDSDTHHATPPPKAPLWPHPPGLNPSPLPQDTAHPCSHAPLHQDAASTQSQWHQQAPIPLYPLPPAPMHLAQVLQQQLLAQQDKLRPREAANCLWALARLQQHFYYGPGGALGPLLDPTLVQLALQHTPGMEPKELSSVLYTCAQLEVRPQGAQLHTCLKCLYQLGYAIEPQALANSVWALGKMRVAPPPRLVRRFLQISYKDMYSFTPQGLVCLVHGLTAMHLHHKLVIPKVWQLKLLDVSWRFMRCGSSDQRISQPDTPQGAQLGGSSELPSVRAGQGSMQVGKQPSLGAQQGDVDSQQQGLQGTQGGVGLSWQLPYGQKAQEGGATTATLGATARQLCPIHASTLIRLLWCLVKGRAFPSRAWLAECFVQIEKQADTLNSVDTVHALWALGQMRRRPPMPILSMLMGKAYTHMAELPLEGLVCVIWAVAQLRARPSAAWAEGFLRLAFRSRERMTPRMVSNTLLSLAQLNLRPNRRFVHGLLLSLHPLSVKNVKLADLVQLSTALPAFKHGLPEELVLEFQQLIDEKLPTLRNDKCREVARRGWVALGLRVEEA